MKKSCDQVEQGYTVTVIYFVKKLSLFAFPYALLLFHAFAKLSCLYVNSLFVAFCRLRVPLKV